MLDAQRFTRFTADERRSFLFGLTGLRCDLETVAPRLEKRGCEASRIEQIGTYLRAGFDDGTFWPTKRPRFPYQEEMLQ